MCQHNRGGRELLKDEQQKEHYLYNIESSIVPLTVKSGSSPGQSLDEFQIKGTRMEGQRLA